jgi:general secretion pathway protein M
VAHERRAAPPQASAHRSAQREGTLVKARNDWQRRDRMWLAIGLLVLALPLVLVGVAVADWHGRAQADMEQLEARHARLRGIVQQRDEIDAALQAAQAARSAYVYPASEDPAQTGNLVQQRMRELLTQAGMQVRSSQVLPPSQEQGFDRVGLLLGADGDLAALQSALAALAAKSPVVMVDDLDIRVQGALNNQRPTDAARLAVRLRLSVLRGRT